MRCSPCAARLRCAAVDTARDERTAAASDTCPRRPRQDHRDMGANQTRKCVHARRELRCAHVIANRGSSYSSAVGRIVVLRKTAKAARWRTAAFSSQAFTRASPTKCGTPPPLIVAPDEARDGFRARSD